MATPSVRYLVDDVAESIAFYTQHFGFTVEMNPGPGFAMLSGGGLRLLLNAVGGSGGASQPMPDGTTPVPGGWTRFQVESSDIDADVGRLRAAGVHLRSDVINGFGGRQVIVDDPSGNAIELFEPGDARPT
jgi:catechol 2,3-dioxygenase-like lactoylglutathione lyase family enzyme